MDTDRYAESSSTVGYFSDVCRRHLPAVTALLCSAYVWLSSLKPSPRRSHDRTAAQIRMLPQIHQKNIYRQEFFDSFYCILWLLWSKENLNDDKSSTNPVGCFCPALPREVSVRMKRQKAFDRRDPDYTEQGAKKLDDTTTINTGAPSSTSPRNFTSGKSSL